MDLELLAAVVDPDGSIDAAKAEELRLRLRTWLLAGGDMTLHQALRLPPTHAKARRALRMAALRRACLMLPGSTRDHARALMAAARRYDGHLRAAWLESAHAPAQADPIMAVMHEAWRADPSPWPTTLNGWQALLEQCRASTKVRRNFEG